MLKTIDIKIECPSCKGTGVFNGVGWEEGVAVICHKCKGEGAHRFLYEYKVFTGRKLKEGIKRVYKKRTHYKIGLGIKEFDTIGKIDMNKEGVSYSEFLQGKMPEDIITLECPMLAAEQRCHKIEGFADECNKLNKGWVNLIIGCKHQPKKEECWKRFNKQTTKG